MAGRMKMLNRFVSTSVKLFLFTALLNVLPQTSYQDTGQKPLIINLVDGDQHVGFGPTCFCYKNSFVPTWWKTWTKIQVKVWSSGLFKVDTVEGEEKLQELDRFSLFSWFSSWIREKHNETTIDVNLFSTKTCFKIDPAQNTQYTVHTLRKFDTFSFLVFLVGALLFIFAGSLSRSQIFFYSAGMSTGMIASLLIVFIILSRFLPKKSPFYALIVGGWSVSLYAIQLVGKNLNIILREHWHAALGYVAVVGFISFAVCYRYGPLVEEKSINILSWTLQLFGLFLIFLGIQIKPLAFTIIIAALVSKNLHYPLSLIIKGFRRLKHFVRWKPEPRRFLTEEEYQKEAEEETRRALEDLRKFCHSPECSPWKAVSRLQSPKRFADFIEGSSHLVPNEVSVHAQEYGLGGAFFEDELFDTDDEDVTSESLSETQNNRASMLGSFTERQRATP
ncbi:nuclear envelope integral membrane protein 1 [Gouania willdenowi]|uniref:Nuclear envelope integral membrane protein 1-like n=1 Tax=Gouania willdenowi TaxID=441366 RepID=A0A8C5G9H8_GOUWI|nr:nuclear envelope integral membrane protein 1-like [Gouania willdenowi]